MYTVKKIETPDRGSMFAVVIGDNIINRFTEEQEEEAKENCTALNGGEAAEKKLIAAEKKAEEDAKKAAAEHTTRVGAATKDKPRSLKQDPAAAKPARAEHEDNHKPRAQPAKAKVAYVKRMAPKAKAKSRRK